LRCGLSSVEVLRDRGDLMHMRRTGTVSAGRAPGHGGHSTPAIPDTWRWVQPSSIRPRHTVMFQSPHTIHWIFELF